MLDIHCHWQLKTIVNLTVPFQNSNIIFINMSRTVP